ncbi:Hypothetical protein LUCI_2589 [Lucifera butyrica]|uniref:Uncharacterized protein n=1 Tax=Lucifera butyrica TaxID=1351585 RepID=A0A498R8P7_9FIRM|nr:hypothetical protein [Lucifera butyrica]VBB07345.1 Hypothetical protein LUCI_2589 [Lucifera butyrica]
MGENQIAVPMDVFLKIIEGQARIEAKLDTHISTESTLENRVYALETDANQAKGGRRMLMWIIPAISGLAAIAGTAITYAVTVGRYIEQFNHLGVK